jgi:hypothetical protein
MPNTTNFNWATPADTDLVKDGAAAIRTLGNSIDSSFVDLKGGTTGQILTKASATDLDFTFVTPNVGDITEVQAGTGISVASGTGPIPTVSINTAVTADLTTAQTLTNKTLTSPVLTTPSISNIDAKGDLLVGTADNTIGRLAVGTNGYTLVADSVEATGLKWAAPASGGKVLQVVPFSTTTSASSSTNAKITTGITANITPSSASSKVLVLSSAMFQKSAANAASRVSLSITRGVTDIYIAENITYNNTATETLSPWAATYLDSPATTSLTTYTVNFANAANVASVSVNAGGSTGSIVLLEIGA